MNPTITHDVWLTSTHGTWILCSRVMILVHITWQQEALPRLKGVRGSVRHRWVMSKLSRCKLTRVCLLCCVCLQSVWYLKHRLAVCMLVGMVVWAKADPRPPLTVSSRLSHSWQKSALLQFVIKSYHSDCGDDGQGFQWLSPVRGGTAQRKIFHLANWSQLIHPGPSSSRSSFFMESSQSFDPLLNWAADHRTRLRPTTSAVNPSRWCAPEPKTAKVPLIGLL